MALKSPYTFLVIFAVFAGSFLFGISIAFGGRKNLLVGAKAIIIDETFVPVDPNDPKVVEIAKFAIDEYNKEKGVSLSFNRVVQAASRNDLEGTNYGLIIEANDATGLSDYDANVIVEKDGTRKLIAFKKRN